MTFWHHYAGLEGASTDGRLRSMNGLILMSNNLVATANECCQECFDCCPSIMDETTLYAHLTLSGASCTFPGTTTIALNHLLDASYGRFWRGSGPWGGSTIEFTFAGRCVDANTITAGYCHDSCTGVSCDTTLGWEATYNFVDTIGCNDELTHFGVPLSSCDLNCEFNVVFNNSPTP